MPRNCRGRISATARLLPANRSALPRPPYPTSLSSAGKAAGCRDARREADCALALPAMKTENTLVRVATEPNLPLPPAARKAILSSCRDEKPRSVPRHFLGPISHCGFARRIVDLSPMNCLRIPTCLPAGHHHDHEYMVPDTLSDMMPGVKACHRPKREVVLRSVLSGLLASIAVVIAFRTVAGAAEPGAGCRAG